MVYFAKWKMILVAVVALAGLLFAFPNALSEEDAAALPSWLPKQKMNLGLDLQGGSHLLLEVDVASVLAQRREALVDSIRDGLRKGSARIGYRRLGVRNECVGFDLRRDEDHDRAREMLRNIEPNSFDPLYEVSTDSLSYTVCNTETGRREILTSAIDQSIEIVRRRIDELGTREPTIQRQGADRILVQVPGLNDPAIPRLSHADPVVAARPEQYACHRSTSETVTTIPSCTWLKGAQWLMARTWSMRRPPFRMVRP